MALEHIHKLPGRLGDGGVGAAYYHQLAGRQALGQIQHKEIPAALRQAVVRHKGDAKADALSCCTDR